MGLVSVGFLGIALSILSTGLASGGEVPQELPDDYVLFEFSLLDAGLVGLSEDLAGFTVTMDLPPASFPVGLSIEALLGVLRQREVTGNLTYPDGRETAVAYEIVRHRGSEETYRKSTLGFLLWESVSVTASGMRVAIYWWYCPPATPDDLAAIDMAARLLEDGSRWHQEDDRACADDVERGRWSLFCALKHASITTMGEFNHHNTAMQTVRFVIDELVPGHGVAHTLMDFNNAAATRPADILKDLGLARERLEAELAGANPSSSGVRD